MRQCFLHVQWAHIFIYAKYTFVKYLYIYVYSVRGELFSFQCKHKTVSANLNAPSEMIWLAIICSGSMDPRSTSSLSPDAHWCSSCKYWAAAKQSKVYRHTSCCSSRGRRNFFLHRIYKIIILTNHAWAIHVHIFICRLKRHAWLIGPCMIYSIFFKSTTWSAIRI